ncbi:Protein SUPPRESSOR OF npr1-1, CONSTITUTIVE 1 [Morella rubra]|uniref:Protein SUPPRESSOR OF npr1-1, CONSTITUTIVE 1 n=1 Tax=Morella rubra TaxID=262757 RepID=A0A6A1WSL4_9ROSI|nr:Protein SUPPRESSOR OF npr1-1, CONSTITUTIVE 1 [Morella rubra]
MYNSLIKELGAEPKNFQNMIMMDFSGCGFLTKILDLSSAVNLKELILRNCGSLVEIHDSVGFLDKLFQLSLNGCSSLNSFPGSLKLRSLEWLDLQGCSSLQQFPEISGTMECLQNLFLADSGIIELPSSIGNLTGLRHIYLGRCRNLLHLPFSILHLQHLEQMSLVDCSKLGELTKKDIGNPLANPLLDEVRTEDCPCGIIFPGNEIPGWFTHPKEEASVSNSCEIDINGLLDLEEIVGIALCAVVQPILRISPKTPTQDVGDFFPRRPDIEAEIKGNVGQRYYIGRSPESMSSDHVWLEYFFVESFKLLRVRTVIVVE